MYPQLLINTTKFKQNIGLLKSKLKAENISLMAVTKVFLADPILVQCCMEAGVDYLADSRIKNLKSLNKFAIKKVLLRLPAPSEVEDVIRYADISLNSELKTIQLLNDAATACHKKHKIILMLDLGDLREGIMPADFDQTVTAIKKFEHIDLIGLGVNLTCYGAIIPSSENLGQLVDFAQRLEEVHGINPSIISGGNSSSLHLIEKNQLPQAINNLRLGEVLVLGRETAYGQKIAGAHDDIFTLRAEIIEKKLKPSLPIGESGVDAFGNKQVYEDKGPMLRAIANIGRQDVLVDKISPLDEDIEIIGASSDHLILDISNSKNDFTIHHACLSITTKKTTLCP